MFLRHFGSCSPPQKTKNITDSLCPSVLFFCGGSVTDVTVKHKPNGVIKMKAESLVWDKGTGNEPLQAEQLFAESCREDEATGQGMLCSSISRDNAIEKLMSYDCSMLNARCNAHRKPFAFTVTDLEVVKEETKQIIKILRQG